MVKCNLVFSGISIMHGFYIAFLRFSLGALVLMATFANAALVAPSAPTVSGTSFSVNQGIAVTVYMPNDPLAIEVQLRTRFAGTELAPKFIRINAGTSRTVTVTLSTPGQYEFYTRTCNTTECSEHSAGTGVYVKQSYQLTAAASTGGSIDPTSKRVDEGATATFNLTPEQYFRIDNVKGCSGSLAGSRYTTAPVAANCEVLATFVPLALKKPAVPLSSASNVVVNQNFTVTVQNPNDPNAMEIQLRVTKPNGQLQVLSFIPLNFTGSKAVTVKLPDIGVHELFVRTCNLVMCSSLSSTTSVNVTPAVASYPVTAIADSNGSISPASSSILHGQTATFIVTPAIGFSISSISGCGKSGTSSPFTTGSVTAACTVTASFKAQAVTASPTVTPNGGSHSAPVSVSLLTTTAGAQIRYTTNGSDVTASSALYSAPFLVSANTTVKAKSFKTGMTDSAQTVANFVFQQSSLQVIYLHTDALGSVIAETDANGKVIKRTEYKPFGESKDN
jgi:hypothetical protein